MKTSDFYYDLPHELIAQKPSENRSESRLLVYNRNTGALSDDIFCNIGNYLKEGDLLVRNTTKVIPARIYGKREETGGRAEFLLLKETQEKDVWKCLTRPAKRVKPGYEYYVNDELKIQILDNDTTDGGKIIRLIYTGELLTVLSKCGEMPLPPYITEKLNDQERYQTVYAKQPGSAAAPTAGLHFTNELMNQLQKNGVQFADILLHVGLGTFRPVTEENVDNHVMHSEYYEIDEYNAELINKAKLENRSVIAIGTTSTRTLESCVNEKGELLAGSGWTNIFIKPGYHFKMVDSQITNFHLPESTLLMLVSALCGREKILEIYKHAVDEKYRFFSFGDAMFII